VTLRVYVYPADEHGCGYHRLIWPAIRLQELGHDVTVVMPGSRALHLELRGDVPVAIRMPSDADVAVFQRVTNRYMAHAIPLMRAQGIAVVVDVDDDLTSIHPANPAWHALHPNNEGKVGANGQISHHSWHHLTTACNAATLVTTSAPALVRRYAPGHGHVVYNHLAEHYYTLDHRDSDVIGWPAALMSHPNDPDVVGNAVARLVNMEGARFIVTANPKGVGRAFGISDDPPGITAQTTIYEWPQVINEIGIGIAPLANTVFNQSKSWLKPLEMSAIGIPWVGSPLPEYSRLHEVYHAGLLADIPKRWYRLLRDLCRSADMRADLAGKGWEAAGRLRLRDNAWRYLEAWELAYDMQHGRTRAAVGVRPIG